MLHDTPRAFVGRATFSVAGPLGEHCAQAVAEELVATPGVTQVFVDAAVGTVSVTVDRPMDREDIVAAVHRAGIRLSNP